MIGRKAMPRRRDKRLDDDVLIVLISVIPLSVLFDL